MRILFASSELAPYAQTGGLGDAVSGLARALHERGHEVICALPAYRDLLAGERVPKLSTAGPVFLENPGGGWRGRWLGGRTPQGLALRLLDLPELYDRPGLYTPPGTPGEIEARRFIALGRAVAQLAAELRPDVLVAHDWHAALALCVLRVAGVGARGAPVATVQTVHNGAFTGRFPAAAMHWTGLPADLFHPDGLEFYGDLCLLKGGLLWADRIVAVSSRYARELLTAERGGGLDGVYRAREARLVGVANGIETDAFDPARDPALTARFDAEKPAPRARCRTALLEETALDTPEPGRLLAMVGRMSEQKGWDVLADAGDALVRRGASLVLLGDGEPEIAARLAALRDRHPRRVHLHVGWNDTLSRRVYAGADAVLVPSRFEPCGLVQLLAQRYGALPIAHAVGGLVDTIADGTTGILFSPLRAEALVDAVERGVALLRERDPVTLRRWLLGQDVSWRGPAERWEGVLEEAIGDPVTFPR